MAKHILVIQGHPDPAGGHFDHALADSYAQGARAGGHTVEQIEVARLDFPLLRTKEDFEAGSPPPSIGEAQEKLAWAQHLLIVYPLWLGGMPALLKGFLEQLLRPGFAFRGDALSSTWETLLRGRSARIVVTMGMPAFAYRWYFRAHSLKSLERNILSFCGIRPIRHSLIGMVEAKDSGSRARWLERLHELGREAR